MNANWIDSPVGPLTIWEKDGAITRLDWKAVEEGTRSGILDQALAELTAYFDGSETGFTVPLAPAGNPFQQKFLRLLSSIPFGHTRTYGEMAKELNVSSQAIGQACGANPIPVIIPCHRVLGADSLGGFSGAGGVEAKIKLLKHEGAASLLI